MGVRCLRTLSIVFAIGIGMCSERVIAEDARVSLGAVTKLSAQIETEQTRETLDLLSLTEAHTAAAFIKATDIGYLDRGSMDALLAELRLSSSGAFDSSSGPARGLLGRLDFLVVIEAALPTSIRLRAIDVKSGAVKSTGICETQTGWLGGRSVDYAECVSPFVDQTLSVARQRLATKKLEAERAAAAALAREEERLEAESAANRAQAEARLDAERRMREDKENADRQRREEMRQRAARQAEIDRMRLDYESAISRATKEIIFWDDMTKMLAEAGNTFRPEISVKLENAKSKRRSCNRYFDDHQPTRLRTCLAELNSQMATLNGYR
jgi:hypothetical protein